MKSQLFSVVILAGGLATRLRPVTATLPKALIKINNEPFIAHQLRLLQRSGIRQVVLCVGYLSDQIIEVVGDGRQFGLNVVYSFDGAQLLGTAGAIKRALPLLEDNFFVLYGDSYLPCDYYVAQSAFINSKKSALMTVFHNSGRWDKSNVELSGSSIVAYDKQYQTEQMQHIDYGLGLFKKLVFDKVPDNQTADLAVLYQDLLEQRELAGLEVTQRFYEAGSFVGIEELACYLSS